MDIKELTKKLPYQWRVQSFSKFNQTATCVAYIDSRDVQRLLDEVCGAENWQDDYKEVKGNVYAGIGIKVNDEWVWKWDCGAESNIEKEKGEASDSFKRAGVKWGIGRFLYDLDIQTVKSSEAKSSTNYPYVVDDNGQKVYNLTKYINDKLKTPNKPEVKPPVDNYEESVYSITVKSCKTLKDLQETWLTIPDEAKTKELVALKDNLKTKLK